MKINERIESDVFVIQPEGRLDVSVLSEFTACLNRTIQEGADKILLDFSKTNYMSSACLRSLIEAYKDMKVEGKILAICSPNEQLNELFKVVYLAKTITIYKSVFEAIKSLLD